MGYLDHYIYEDIRFLHKYVLHPYDAKNNVKYIKIELENIKYQKRNIVSYQFIIEIAFLFYIMKPKKLRINSKPDKKKKGGKNKYYKGKTDKTVSLTLILGLLDQIEVNRTNFQKRFDAIYEIFAVDYEKEEFRSDAELIFEELRTPVQMSLWILYPKKFLQLLRNKDEEMIIECLRIFADLAEDQEEVYSFIFPEEKYPEEIFQSYKRYKSDSKLIMKSIEKKISNNILDLTNLSQDFIDELIEIMDTWDLAVEKFDLGTEQNLVFYTIALIFFKDILLYQSIKSDTEIDDAILKIKNFAVSSEFKRVINLFE